MSSAEYFVEKEVAPAPKRIVICCDGTWQSATSLDPSKGCSSNVTRLVRALANAGKDANGTVWQQVVYYDAGIGTGDLSFSERIRQGSLGVGLVENILEAYNFIVNNYNPGDQLFFFGFSRGAYTVRATAGLVCAMGVIMPSNMPAFIKFYGAYMQSKEKNLGSFQNYAPWVKYQEETPGHSKTLQSEVKIQVIGVWDTVGSLGVPDLGHFFTIRKADPRNYQFYDTDLNPKILHAYQALGLDEYRKAFSPTVWKLPPDDKTTELVQCWFPGAHINIGGGSSSSAGEKPKNDHEQLAAVTFAWMCDRVRPHLTLSESALDWQINAFKRLAEMESAPVEQSTTAYLKSFVWSSAPTSTIKPGYATGIIADSHSLQYDLMSFPQERTPNNLNYYEVHDTDKTGEDSIVETLTNNDFTHECIHPSVYYRDAVYQQHDKTGYKPPALKGWERRQITSGKRKGWYWTKKLEEGGAKKVAAAANQKISGMWEAELVDMGKRADGKEVSVERRLIDACGALIKPFHEESCKAWKA